MLKDFAGAYEHERGRIGLSPSVSGRHAVDPVQVSEPSTPSDGTAPVWVFGESARGRLITIAAFTGFDELFAFAQSLGVDQHNLLLCR
jgi:hypothetical protein